jgi:hypothetical protein
MVDDPQTGKAEHLAVFFEHGAHEPWSNTSGSSAAAPKHAADDVSFLPRRIAVLGRPEDEPFTYFGGKFGEADSIRRQPFWYRDTWSFGLEEAARPPYRPFGRAPWPPKLPA